MPLLCAACASTPKYEVAGPECLEYAIASCRAAIVEDHMEAGLIHYIPSWGGGVAHVVVWVKGEDGIERIYDPSFRVYRKMGSGDIVLHKGNGLDLGIYARLLLKDIGRSEPARVTKSGENKIGSGQAVAAL